MLAPLPLSGGMDGDAAVKVKSLIKSSGLATLAAVLALTAVPAEVFAQANERGWSGGSRGAENRAARIERGGNIRANRIERRTENRANRIENRGDFRADRVQRQTNNRSPRVESWGDRRSAQIERRTERRAENVERRGTWQADRVNRQSENRADRIRDNNNRNIRDNNRNDNRWNNNNNNRNWSYRDNNRNRSYVDRNRNNSYRDGYRDGRRDDRRWDRRWRDDRRYNWSDYRRSHRHIYRMGPYYAPYHGYSYRRLSIGFFMDSMFFSSRYWINDPGYYRLPPAYGGYRWVRYYDDALLVDIYSGEVVDVIHNFFW